MKRFSYYAVSLALLGHASFALQLKQNDQLLAETRV